MSMTGSAGIGAAKRRWLAPFAAAIVCLASVQPASAQSGSSGWQFELTPYVWTTGLKGNVKTPTLPNTNVDVSFSDVFDVLDFAFAGAFEARKDKLGLFVDAQYYKLSPSAVSSATGPLGNTLTVNADAKIKQTILAAGAAYRVVEGRAPVDVIGGLRYTMLDVEAKADFTLLGHTASTSNGGDKDWVDPYIGVRLLQPLSDRWSFLGYADLGGFGVGSDFTWQVQAGLEYRVSDKYTVKFGYRVLDVDYDKDGFVYNMKTDGLYIGMGIRF